MKEIRKLPTNRRESARIKKEIFLLLIAEELYFTACGGNWNTEN